MRECTIIVGFGILKEWGLAMEGVHPQKILEMVYSSLFLMHSALEVLSPNALYKFTFYITLHYIVPVELSKFASYFG